MGKNDKQNGFDSDYDEGFAPSKVNFKQYIHNLQEETVNGTELLEAKCLSKKDGSLIIGFSAHELGDDLHLTVEEWSNIKALAMEEELEVEREDLTWYISRTNDNFIVFDSGFNGCYGLISRTDAIRKFQ